MVTWGSTILLGLLGLILVSVSIEDARKREIADWKNLAIAALAPLWWWSTGLHLWPDVAIQVALAAFVFVLFIGVFALGQMGGGDVKLIGALALWLPAAALFWMLALMAVLGGALTLLMLAGKWLRGDSRPLETPYGIAIAAATLVVIGEPIFNHFG